MCREAAGFELAAKVPCIFNIQAWVVRFYYYQYEVQVLMAYQALYRKWRPQVFEDVVGQQHIIETIKNNSKVFKTNNNLENERENN